MENEELLSRDDVVEIKGYEGFYAIQSNGDVWSLKRPYRNNFGETSVYKELQKMIPCLDGAGCYYMINLHKNGKSRKHSIHRLVATHFLENKENKEEVNHIDGIKTNNNVSNLEWCSRVENIRHAIETGLKKPIKGRNILQTTKDGTVVNKHESIRGAARAMNKGMGNIANCCRGKLKSAYGYIWKYDDMN